MPPSLSTSSSVNSMEDVMRNYSLPQASDPPERDDRRLRSAKDNLLAYVQHIDNSDLRHAVKAEVKRLLADHNRLVIMLQQRSEMLEQEIEDLKLMTSDHQRKYEKAVREMQFFKKKYERAAELSKQPQQQQQPVVATRPRPRPRSLSINSASSDEIAPPMHPTQTITTPSSALHSYPLTPTSPQPSTPTVDATSLAFVQTKPTLPTAPSTASATPPTSASPTSDATAPAAGYWNSASSNDITSRNRQSSIATASVHSSYSTSTDGQNSQKTDGGKASSPKRKQSWQFLQQNPSTGSPSTGPASTISAPSGGGIVQSSPMAPVRSSTATNGYTGASLIQQRRVDPLIFGGSDALWETIAKSKGSDATVEKIISNFLRRGGSPNTAKQSPSAIAVKYGFGMIHALIVTKAPGALDLLLQQGGNPNAMTLSQVEDDKVTPVYLAASVGWLPGLQKLIQAGGDMIAARGGGAKNKTALHIAAEHCHAAVVEYIVGATQGTLNLEVDSMGATVVHYACASGHTDLVSFLVRGCQLPVDTADERGELPLHWAARQGRLEVVTLLVERCGCDCNAYTPRRVGTPLDLAKAGGHKRLVDYLKGIGAQTSKKLEKKREEEAEKNVAPHLESTLSRNGFFAE